ncbi:MAG: hypothetical protein GEV11_20865 [Streptosporangiales bacterium]|nr:hypothetical protein [Streptosporangiales bacterium]
MTEGYRQAVGGVVPVAAVLLPHPRLHRRARHRWHAAARRRRGSGRRDRRCDRADPRAPLVMTLGMIGVVYGVIRLYTGGQPKGSAAPAMRELVAGDTVFGIPGVWLWAGLGAIVLVLLRRTSFGWRLYAVGANREVARLSGVAVRPTLLTVYTLSGLFAGVGGLLLLGYTQSVFLRLADAYMLPTVAAVVVGGTALIGGVGGYLGTVLGAVLLTVLDSFLKILQIGGSGSDAPRQIVYGAVLLVLLSIYGRQRRLRS